MNDISNPMVQMLEKFLSLASQRHTLITSNIANLDTPGYRTRDFDFRGELRRAITTEDPVMTPIARVIPGLMERPDGNNVSMDRESLLMAETQLQFNIGVQLIRNQFQQIMTAINEGSKG
jgi:flagellar basal-body rod protein FlgB